MKVTVTAAKDLHYAGIKYVAGAKLELEKDVASRLAAQGLIRTLVVPIIDKMMWIPRKVKTKGV